MFARAAGDIGGLMATADSASIAKPLVEAIVQNPPNWSDWLPLVLEAAPADLPKAALRLMGEMQGAVPGWVSIVRRLADASGDVDAFQATFTEEGLRSPAMAAEVAQRLLRAGRLDDARRVLEGAVPKAGGGRMFGGRAPDPDFDWETTWIDYLERSGQTDAAQAVRWSSFERTLSVDRLKAFTRGLAEFQDVEAEQRAFDYAAHHSDFARGLRFLMRWPALPEAARMIQARPDDVQAPPEQAELWAAQLRRRQPAAAEMLLRKAAAAAFRRRDFATSDRLAKEADAINP